METEKSTVWDKPGVLVLRVLDGAFRSNGRLFTAFLLLIVALKWPFFTIPPVWDEAFSIFPAADFLINNGFDYRLMLEQPRYHGGGPTASGLSLMTLGTALVLKVTGGGTPAWMVLHGLQWLMAAGIGVMLTRMFGTVIGKAQALLLAVACLVYPMVLAQIGFMYLEVPVLFFTLLAATLFLSSRFWLASLLLVAACLTKGSALIGVGALTLTALCCHGKPLTRRFADALILAAPALLTVRAVMEATSYRLPLATTESISEIFAGIISRNIFAYHAYIATVPEMIFLLIAGLILGLVYFVRHFSGPAETDRFGQLTILFHSIFVLVYLIFYGIIHNYTMHGDSHFLTRYFVYVIPSLFFVIYLVIDRLLPRQDLKILILALLVLLFLVNRSGVLYPPLQFPSIAMAERSEEYLDGYVVSREYTALLEREVPEDVPIFVSLPDYFLTQYPVNGYVTKPCQTYGTS